MSVPIPASDARWWATLSVDTAIGKRTDRNAIIGYDHQLQSFFCHGFEYYDETTGADALGLLLGIEHRQYVTFDERISRLNELGVDLVEWELDHASTNSDI
ncbi:hypothetical protein IG197_31925 (plasmid) [Aminobacter sp. SR38]|jgi:hypothetical protein|uniref:hypothetical protein n=1 Tax=Aminobacter sp. SR38 TaxID=2774562 RepID=UPI001780615E|nr:hypothetical protein [Aminobacter sp. SR38]QOF75196.1 hypothetical protein IG197_31925 [Aminobacter sp. SR38]